MSAQSPTRSPSIPETVGERGLIDSWAGRRFTSVMFPDAFDPFEFFASPTIGSGAVFDFTGRLIRRCQIETSAFDSVEFGALHFDERYTFSDGSPDDTLNWAVERTLEGLVAHEPSVDGEMVAALDGCTWRVGFRRLGGMPMFYDVTFTQVAPNVALKLVRLKRFGFTLARLHAFHRHITG